MVSSLTTIEQCPGENHVLNSPFTESEISKAIKQLKNGKATGPPDHIGNEFLKRFNTVIIKPLCKLYNCILEKGQFPSEWSTSYIVPIFKTGDKNDLNNYRGIAISSCVSKLFSSLLCNRLDTHMNENNLWSANQAGFKKGHRTEDNMFVLNTIIQSHTVKKDNNVFVAFVDFKKFFDRINRDLLMYKLLKYNVTGKFYHIIKSMYTKTNYRVKLYNGLSKLFCGNIGVKQGCNLSPSLSNLYQNDLQSIFDDFCDPVLLGDCKINSLSWADDLVLMSSSQTGLQECLNKLHDYCYKWGLEINTLKTKCLCISNKKSKNLPQFTYNDIALETVKSYKYLGIIFQSNGKYDKTVKDVINKCARSNYLIKSAMNVGGTYSVSLAYELFEKQVLPIINYGSSIWSLPRVSNILYLDNVKNDVTNIKTYVTRIVNTISGNKLKFNMARRIGTKNSCTRPILIKFNNIEDKEFFSQAIRSSNAHSNLSCRNPDILYDEYDIEKIHTKFCKQILGLRRNTSNMGALGELGKYPVIFKNWTLAIKYWLRLELGSQNELLNRAYKVAKAENHYFCQSIKGLLFQNGFGYIWDNPILVTKHFHSTFSKRLQDEFLQTWSSKTSGSNITKLLNSLKEDNYNFSSYLHIVKDPQIRQIFTRLRLSTHCLQECTGRYSGIVKEERICKLCDSNKVESVEHFILHCNKFSAERNLRFSQITHIYGGFASMSDFQKLKNILNLNLLQCNDIICAFLNNIYKERQKLC